MFATAGKKHLYLWDCDAGGDKKKGLFGSFEMTSFACCTWDMNGNVYAGGSNSKIYVFSAENRQCISCIDAHKSGFIPALTFVPSMNCVLSGCSDGQICKIDCNSGEVSECHQFNSAVRAISCNANGDMLVGTRDGCIVEKCADGSCKELMYSHNDGETWGLDVTDYPSICTSGDDNKIIVWDTANRCKKECYKLTDREEGNNKQNGASTQSKLCASQCSRALACKDGIISAAGNDGKVTFDIKNNGETVDVSKRWIEVMQYSPCGRFLAIGSHDCCIYIYEGTTCKSKL